MYNDLQNEKGAVHKKTHLYCGKNCKAHFGKLPTAKYEKEIEKNSSFCKTAVHNWPSKNNSKLLKAKKYIYSFRY